MFALKQGEDPRTVAYPGQNLYVEDYPSDEVIRNCGCDIRKLNIIGPYGLMVGPFPGPQQAQWCGEEPQSECNCNSCNKHYKKKVCLLSHGGMYVTKRSNESVWLMVGRYAFSTDKVLAKYSKGHVTWELPAVSDEYIQRSTTFTLTSYKDRMLMLKKLIDRDPDLLFIIRDNADPSITQAAKALVNEVSKRVHDHILPIRNELNRRWLDLGYPLDCIAFQPYL